MDIKPGEVYWVTIPQNHTVGSEQFKRRPFVIVSRLLLNRKGNVVVGVPFTTASTDKPDPPPHRILIPANEILRDVLYTGPIEMSVALTDQVRALDKTRLEQRIGMLSATALTAIGLGLAYVFDLR